MQKGLLLIGLLCGLAGCAQRVPIDQQAQIVFVRAQESRQISVIGRTIYLQEGVGYPSVQLADGRRVVILDRYTSNDPFLLFANLSQTWGSVLDENGCTTESPVSVNRGDVVIEESGIAGRIESGICFEV